MITNKIIALILIYCSYKMYNYRKTFGTEGLEKVERIRSVGTAIMILTLALVFLFTKKNFCEIFNLGDTILCF